MRLIAHKSIRMKSLYIRSCGICKRVVYTVSPMRCWRIQREDFHYGRYGLPARPAPMLNEEDLAMTVFGVALLAICTLVGVFIGDLLGIALGVKANVGGVGLAMMMLIVARVWLVRRDGLSHGVKLGVEFWATMYIPIVVAMAAQQNVVAAARGGPVVLIAGLGAVSICFACVALISRFGEKRELPPEEVAEIERGGYVIGGDTPPDYAAPAPGREPALATHPVSSAKKA